MAALLFLGREQHWDVTAAAARPRVGAAFIWCPVSRYCLVWSRNFNFYGAKDGTVPITRRLGSGSCKQRVGALSPGSPLSPPCMEHLQPSAKQSNPWSIHLFILMSLGFFFPSLFSVFSFFFCCSSFLLATAGAVF